MFSISSFSIAPSVGSFHCFQVRNLRIGAMMRTILPALAQAIVMNSSPDYLFKGTTERLQKMQVLIPYIPSPFSYH